MRGLVLIFAASLMAQKPVREGRFEAIGSTPSRPFITIDGPTSTLRVLGTGGAERVVLQGFGLAGLGGGETGVISIKTGGVLSETTVVDIRSNGIFAPRLRVGTGTAARGFIPPDSVSGLLDWKLPTADGAGVWASDGAGNLSITNDYVTRTTVQSFASGITASKTLAGSSAELIGAETLGVERWRLTQNGLARFTMRDTSGTNTVVDISGGASQGEVWVSTENFFGTASRTAGLSGNAVFGQRLMLATDPSGFTFRGFEVPSGAFGSVLWKLPLSDANGCLKSDGAGNLSISACSTGGVNQVTGTGLIQVSPTTGNVVVACPTCARTDGANTFAVASTFNSGLNVFATSIAFAVKGFFSEDIVNVSAGAGTVFRNVFGSPVASIDRNGIFSSQGAAGLASATCSSATFQVRGGLVVSCP